MENESCKTMSVCREDTPPTVTQVEFFRAPKVHQCGYDCEFVTAPPSLLESECAICLQVLREPHLISCCGHNYCRVCIELVRKEERPCPLCSEPSFTVLHNGGLERALNQLQVHCTYRKAGCQWSGELGVLDKHLNESPTLESQLQGCDYVQVECVHGCGGQFKRGLANHHQTEVCPQRPFCCDYCQDYTSIHADVVYRHWPVCKCYPLSCPNRCTVYAIERQNLEEHLSTECPLKVVECGFQYAGCDARLPRKDMPSHLEENHVQHTTLLAAMNQKFAEDLVEKDEQLSQLHEEMQSQLAALRHEQEGEVAKLQQENSWLKMELAQVREEMSALVHSCKQAITEMRGIQKNQMAELREEDQVLRGQISDLRSALNMEKDVLSEQCYSVQAYMGLFPVEFTMKTFEQYRSEDGEWQSPPFYSHLQGYKMCLLVNANGHGSVKGTHVSVWVHLMRGEFDDQLKWPFRGEVTIQLLNQLGDRNHATGTIHFTDWTPDMYRSRVERRERAEKGLGIQEFIGHHNLDFNPAKNRQYLRDGRLCFRVTRVKHIT